MLQALEHERAGKLHFAQDLNVRDPFRAKGLRVDLKKDAFRSSFERPTRISCETFAR